MALPWVRAHVAWHRPDRDAIAASSIAPLCIAGQRRTAPIGHTDHMQPHSITSVIAASWIVAILLVGRFYSVTSVLGWALLAGFAVLPLLGMLRLWNTPRESMSQTIQKALR